jgi:membrane-bound metal-dependent hydrolase YbcI (DUF457 family)
LNFSGHISCGVVSAAAVTGATYGICTAANIIPPNYPLVFGLSAAFSLFPDLDIQSTPQKWFFRIMLLTSIILLALGKTDICSYILIASIIPLVDHHRGFTHWWLTSIFAVPLIFFGIYKATNIQLEGIVFLGAACLVGWWTHLLCDGIYPWKKR